MNSSKLLIVILALSGALAHAECDSKHSIFNWALTVSHDFDNEKNNRAPCTKIQKRMKVLENQGMKSCSEWGALDEAEMEICGN